MITYAMLVEARRAACPSCQEPIDVRASVCPHCRRCALLQVKVVAPITDPRLRYALARKLCALDRGSSVSELIEALGSGRPVLRRVTRELADA
ncbi:MAG TPA: hypothetical protein VNN80_09930, partial [Polyangiaceae bacterium]|nr:hypothetical protein [Polyangiaceae bacterium]